MKKPGVLLKNLMMGFLISDFRRDMAHRRGRRTRKGQPIVHFFHQVDDPYSHMAAQKLDDLKTHYEVKFEIHAVSSPGAEYQGDSSRFRDWAMRDAHSVADFYGVELPDDFESTAPQDSATTAAGNALRQKLGHYLSGTFYFEGEWYWGLDRLLHLEDRLSKMGLSNMPGSFCVPRPEPESATGLEAGTVTLEYFPSLRSPYTAISYDRTIDLVRRSGVKFKLRPVMPMMMRGIPAPRAKQIYIITDTKREADYYSVPFGNIIDPFGEPVKRAFALFPYMQSIGRDIEYCSNYLRASWAEGVDITTDAGLRSVVERSGGDWQAAISSRDDWSNLLELNVADMLEAGLWGVPSFRVSGGNRGDTFSCWGQDRLWRVETEIARRASAA